MGTASPASRYELWANLDYDKTGYVSLREISEACTLTSAVHKRANSPKLFEADSEEDARLWFDFKAWCGSTFNGTFLNCRRSFGGFVLRLLWAFRYTFSLQSLRKDMMLQILGTGAEEQRQKPNTRSVLASRPPNRTKLCSFGSFWLDVHSPSPLSHLRKALRLQDGWNLLVPTHWHDSYT